ALPIVGRNYQDVLTQAPGIVDFDGDGKATTHGARDTDVAQARAETVRANVIMALALPGRLDIPSDGQPHQHLIATHEIGARVEYQCVPAISPEVFVAARLTLPDDLPLLPAR